MFSILSTALALPVTVFGQAAAGGQAAGGKTVETIAAAVRSTLTTVGGSIVFIGWVFTGILYLTAAGKPEKINVAKGAIIACTIGTLLVILAGVSGVITDVVKNAFGLQ